MNQQTACGTEKLIDVGRTLKAFLLFNFFDFTPHLRLEKASMENFFDPSTFLFLRFCWNDSTKNDDLPSGNNHNVTNIHRTLSDLVVFIFQQGSPTHFLKDHSVLYSTSPDLS